MSRWFLVVLGVVVTTGCAGEHGAGSPTPSAPVASQHELVHAALCDVTASAVAGDHSSARSAFFDQVHQPLHDLAADVAEVDREVAAELHRAKHAAEAELRAGRPGRRQLEGLEAVTARAVAAIDGLPPTCAGSAAAAPTEHQQEASR